MRVFLLLFFTIGLSALDAVKAQKVDIDKESFTVSRMLLPFEPLDDDVYFFEVKVHNDPSVQEYISDESIASAVQIEGMRQAYNQEKHFDVQVSTSAFILGIPKMKTRVEESKDKQGRVTRTTHYSFTIQYSWEASFESTKPDGTVLNPKRVVFSNNNAMEYTSQEYGSSAGLKQYLDVNLKALKSKLLENCAKKLTGEISSYLSYLVGYRKQKYTDYFWNMDSKKHPENDEFRRNVGLLLSEISRLDYNSMPEGIEERIGSSIRYFTALSKGDTEDKNNKKLVYASAFNLATLYFAIDQPLKAKEWGQFLIDHDIDRKEGESFVKSSETLESAFLANDIFTSHFERQIPEPSGSDLPNTQASAQEEIAEYVQCIVVTSEDKEIEGYLINDFHNKPWEVQDGVLFVPKEVFNNGDFNKKDIEKYNPKELKAIILDKTPFIPVVFSDVTKLSSGNLLSATAKKRFLQVVKDGKYKLLRFYEEPSSAMVFSGSIPENESDMTDAGFYPLLLEPESEKAVLITTKVIEDIIEKNKALFARYQKGEFSKDGQPIDTKRSLLARIEAKVDLDENINLELLIDELNK